MSFQPLDVSQNLAANQQLGAVNAQNAAERRNRQAAKRRFYATAMGIAAGAVAGPAAGLTVMQGAALGGQAAPALLEGRPEGVAMAGLNAASMAEQGQARMARQQAAAGVQSALNPPPAIDETGRETPGVVNPARLVSALARDPSLVPTAVQAGLTLRGQERQEALAGLKMAAQAHEGAAGRAVTVRGQDIGKESAAAGRTSQEDIAEKNRQAKSEQNALKIEADKFIAENKLKADDESTDRMRARLTGKVLVGTATDIEKQALLRL